MATSKKTKAPVDSDTLAENGTEEVKERPYYEEWNCQITPQKGQEPKVDKLKLTRKRVLISDEQADILNQGRIYGDNSYAKLYFKPE